MSSSYSNNGTTEALGFSKLPDPGNGVRTVRIITQVVRTLVGVSGISG